MSTILVTGANRGIGLEFVKQYMAMGEQVIGTYRDVGSSDELIKLSEDSSCLLYTSPSPRDRQKTRMPSSA